jgi:hypothetical protein
MYYHTCYKILFDPFHSRFSCTGQPVFPTGRNFCRRHTKVAGKKYKRQKKTAANSAAKIREKGQKSRRKKILEVNFLDILVGSSAGGSLDSEGRRCHILLNRR